MDDSTFLNLWQIHRISVFFIQIQNLLRYGAYFQIRMFAHCFDIAVTSFPGFISCKIANDYSIRSNNRIRCFQSFIKLVQALSEMFYSCSQCRR